MHAFNPFTAKDVLRSEFRVCVCVCELKCAWVRFVFSKLAIRWVQQEFTIPNCRICLIATMEYILNVWKYEECAVFANISWCCCFRISNYRAKCSKMKRKRGGNIQMITTFNINKVVACLKPLPPFAMFFISLSVRKSVFFHVTWRFQRDKWCRFDRHEPSISAVTAKNSKIMTRNLRKNHVNFTN